jgi:conjugal transfer/entry exclusion protein
MRNKIPALIADITLATEKLNHWSAQAKALQAAKGLLDPETKRAKDLASLWASELDAKQEELDYETDGEEVAYHSEFAPVD